MGRIPEEIIDQVIDRCDIVDVVSSYIPLKKAGRNFKALCPFHHEKTPSFVVNPDKQIYHCFGCGEGGNVISFVMKHDHMEFPEAMRELAAKVGVEIPEENREAARSKNLRQKIFQVNALAVEYYHQLLLSDKSKGPKKARDYLKKRGLSLEIVREFKLGVALDEWEGLIGYLKGKNIPVDLMEKAGLIIPRKDNKGHYDRFRNRIIFPIFDTRANCRAFGARVLDSDEETAKYINSPETFVYEKGHHLYGFHLARNHISQNDAVIIVEGYLDCISPYQAGVTNIVASLGTALTVEQIRLIRRYTKNAYLLFDTDKAGEAAMMRSFDTLIEEDMNVYVASLEEGEDPDSFIQKYGEAEFRERVAKAKGLFDYKLDVLQNKFDIHSVEGKADIADGMLESIQRVGNQVKKSALVRKLAGALGIPEQALYDQLATLERNARRRDREPEAERRPEEWTGTVKRRVEYHMLKLLLEENQFIERFQKDYTETDFQDQKVRGIISRMFTLFKEGREINAGSLLSNLEDSESKKTISALLADEEFVVGNAERMFDDYVKKLKSDRLKAQKQQLMSEIRQAELNGDEKRLDELKKEFHTLIKQ